MKLELVKINSRYIKDFGSSSEMWSSESETFQKLVEMYAFLDGDDEVMMYHLKDIFGERSDDWYSVTLKRIKDYEIF